MTSPADRALPQADERQKGLQQAVSPDVMRKLISYSWPGNVRELSHALERMMVLSDTDILVETDLPDEIRESFAGAVPSRDLPTGLTMDELEKLAITKALDACDGNRTHAAQRLNISVRTLQRKLQQYQLEKDGESDTTPSIPAEQANPAQA